MPAALHTRRSLQMASLSISGFGLVLAGVAFWMLLRDYGPAYDSAAPDLGAVPVSVDFRAPALALADMHGATHALSDYLGTVVLINLWATWCAPCEAEMPAFQHFYEQQREAGFSVIAINDGEPEADVARFVRAHVLTFPVWLDPEFRASEQTFRARSLPTSYVIDRAGTVRLMWIGAISEAGLRQYVTPIIKE